MRSAECRAFLKQVLPAFGLRWAGYRKVHRTLCKRLVRRLRELGLADLEDYRHLLESDPQERAQFEAICRIPISRFFRDREVFDVLAREVLPELAQAARDEGRPIKVWSCGCASGEEPYSLAILWQAALGPAFPDVQLEIIATDADPVLLERARIGCYKPSSLCEVPPEMRDLAFVRRNGLLCIRERCRRMILFLLQDVRKAAPAGKFDLVLCRNLVFTYFEPAVQIDMLAVFASRLQPRGWLVVGRGERLPHPAHGFAALRADLPVCRLTPRGASASGVCQAR